jgi:hypothetical protein
MRLLSWSVAAVVLVSQTSANPQSTTPQFARVFIVDEMKSEGWIAPGAEERMASARDLARALHHPRSVLRVIENREEADVLIAITRRHDIETETTVFSGGIAKKLLGRTVEARAQVSDATFEFAGTTKTRFWSNAAEDLAKEIESWAKNNLQRIVSARQK